MVRKVPPIKQRIEIEGGDKIRRDFKRLGVEAEKSFRNLQDAIRATNGPARRLASSFTQLRKTTQRFGGAFRTFTGNLAKVSGAFAVLGFSAQRAVRAISDFFTGALQTADEAGKLATRLGTTADRVKQLDSLAKLSGSSLATIERAFNSINKAIAELEKVQTSAGNSAKKSGPQVGKWFQRIIAGQAQQTIFVTAKNIAELQKQFDKTNKTAGDTKGLNEQLKVLRELGLNAQTVRDENGKLLDTFDIFLKIADGLKKFEDQALRSGNAAILLSKRAGPELAPLLELGSEGIRKLVKELQGLGIGTERAVRNAGISAVFNDLVQNIQDSFSARREDFASTIAAGLIKPLEEVKARLIENNAAITAEVERVGTELQGLFQDLFNTLAFDFSGEGGALTFFREDEVSQQREYLISLRDGVIDFANAVSGLINGVVIPAWTAFTAVLEPVAFVINKIFGTELNGQVLGFILLLGSLTGVFSLIAAGAAAIIAPFTFIASLFGVTLTATTVLSAALTGLGKALAGIAVIVGGEIIGAFKALNLAVGANLTKSFLTFAGKAVAALGRVLFLILRFTSIPALIIGGLVAVVAYWDQIVAAGQKAFDSITGFFADLWDDSLAEKFFKSIVSLASSAFSSIGSILGELFGGGSAQAAESPSAGGGGSVGNVGEGSTESAEAFWGGFTELGRKAWAEVVTIGTESLQQIIAAAQALNFDLVEGEIVAPFQRAVDAVRNFLNDLVAYVESSFNQIVSTLEDVASRVEDLADRIEEAARRAKDAVDSIPSGGGGSGFATGGYVSGPGSGTSDSIPAWLSDGEFVIRAAAVRKYGLAFLSAVNGMRLGGSRRKRREDAPKFATGGLASLSGVSFQMPKFALGGLVDAAAPQVKIPATLPEISQPNLPGKSFDLNIGAEAFSGLFAPQNVARELEEYARRSATRSAGVKPSWYGGRR